MIRRSTALIAGAMLLGAMLTCAGPAAAQGAGVSPHPAQQLQNAPASAASPSPGG